MRSEHAKAYSNDIWADSKTFLVVLGKEKKIYVHPSQKAEQQSDSTKVSVDSIGRNSSP